MKGITMVKIDEYVDRRLAEKVEAVKSYIDLKIVELNGQYKGLEGQMHGLRDSFEGLRGEVRGLKSQGDGLNAKLDAVNIKVDIVLDELRRKYDLINGQYNDVMGLLRIVIERTNPDKIGFGPKDDEKK